VALSFVKPNIMTNKFLSVAFVALLLFSCKEAKTEPVEAENTTPTTTEEVVQPETSAEETPQNTETTEAQTQVETQQTPTNAGPFTQQPQQNTQKTQTTGKTAPGFSGKPNPAHGQPGHRCDIKVGDILP